MQCSNIQEQKLYIPWIAVFLWYQKEYVDFDIYFSFNFRITKVIPEMRKKKQLNCMSSWVTKNRRIKSEKNCLIKKAKMGEKGNFCCIASVAYRHPEIYLLFIRTFLFHLIFFRFFLLHSLSAAFHFDWSMRMGQGIQIQFFYLYAPMR